MISLVAQRKKVKVDSLSKASTIENMRTMRQKSGPGTGITNTGYNGVTYTMMGTRRLYQATNRRNGRRRKFYINSERSREQAFMRALAYARS